MVEQPVTRVWCVAGPKPAPFTNELNTNGYLFVTDHPFVTYLLVFTDTQADWTPVV